MASPISRLYDFIAGTKIRSSQVDEEFNQLVSAHNSLVSDIGTIQGDIGTIQGENLASTAHESNVANPHSVTKTQVGLGNVDNTSDTNKPVSTLQAASLATKVDKVAGKGLSTEDFTQDEKTKLAGIATSANNYSHPASHPASMITDLPTGKKVARFVVGTSTAGWTAADCDYLCDGTADQTEINAAITALPATGGEIVILDGTYNITAKIDVTKDNVSIRGNGNATILKRMFDSSVAEGVITLTNRSGCKIANLQIEGNNTSYTNSRNYGIYLDDASNNNTVTGNTCTGNRSSGIYLRDSSDNTVIGNTCTGNSSSGIHLAWSSNNNTVTGNTCYSNNNYGIYLNASSNNNTVTGNTCYNNSYGIDLNSTSNNNTVTGNTCYINVCGIYLSASNNNTVIGNTCTGNSSSGIYLASSNNNTVTGNTCIRGTGLAADYIASQHTIKLTGTDNSYNLIAMNNCMGKAVTNEGGTGNTLVNNKFDAT